MKLEPAANQIDTLPDTDGGWTWNDWVECNAKMTSPDTGDFGAWARDGYEFQYMPQMYSNGMPKPLNDPLTKTMYDLPEALEAWEHLINKILVHETSPPADQVNELGGEFGNRNTAAKVGIWPSGRVYSTGFAVPRIEDCCKWTFPKASPATRSVRLAGPPRAGQESLDTTRPHIAPYASECRWPLRAFGLCNVHRTIRRWREVS